ncbi:MAG: DUF3606 domain-containing protein [Pseudomonadota bacterium]
MMANRIFLQGHVDPTAINIKKASDLRLWAEEMRCTVRQLEAAIDEVGTDPADVRRRLRRHAGG